MRFRPGESAHVRTSERCVLYCTEHACMCSTVALCIMFKYHIAHALAFAVLDSSTGIIAPYAYHLTERGAIELRSFDKGPVPRALDSRFDEHGPAHKAHV